MSRVYLGQVLSHHDRYAIIKVVRERQPCYPQLGGQFFCQIYVKVSLDAQETFEVLPLILQAREEPSKFRVVFEYNLALSQFHTAYILVSLSTS